MAAKKKAVTVAEAMKIIDRYFDVIVPLGDRAKIAVRIKQEEVDRIAEQEGLYPNVSTGVVITIKDGKKKYVLFEMGYGWGEYGLMPA